MMVEQEDVVARTIWGEARGEGTEGMEAVAAVIMNRAHHPRWWGRTPADVCLKPWQFSCWNKNDPNLAKMAAVTVEDPQFATAKSIAARAVAGNLKDPTNNADSYADLRVCAPNWAQNARFVAKVGNHSFFRLEL